MRVGRRLWGVLAVQPPAASSCYRFWLASHPDRLREIIFCDVKRYGVIWMAFQRKNAAAATGTESPYSNSISGCSRIVRGSCASKEKAAEPQFTRSFVGSRNLGRPTN